MTKRNRNSKPIIAVIDTGIDKNVSYSSDIIENFELTITKKKVVILKDSMDVVGHGTKVASCIKKYCPSAKLLIINIYGKNGITYSVLLLEALKLLINKKVDIINLSLSVNSEENIIQLNNVMRKLHRQGKTIVASVKNGYKESFPANSPYCIGVLGTTKLQKNNFIVDMKEKIQIITSIYPEEVETIENRKEYFGGNSKAAACVTGCIGTIREILYIN